MRACVCQIVPPDVLARLAKDRKLTPAQRRAFARAAKLEPEWRGLRAATTRVAQLCRDTLPVATVAAAVQAPVSITVFDCEHGNVLPGRSVIQPYSSGDDTARRTFTETTEVARFYREIFGRNSLDGEGMALMSSIHYSVDYNNAFWNGGQMVYGDGDGEIFLDFTRATDVIAHELTHGVTQFTAGLAYEGEAGGLNESMSDVFGTMFRQWRAGQNVAAADWLIGADILGPGARARGYTCLRDLADPGADHCLAPQPSHFSQYRKGMDPHESSGMPNHAFQQAAMALEGHSWEIAGRIWFQALTGPAPSPNMTMKLFANRTRTAASKLFSGRPAVRAAVDVAWKVVGL